MQILLEYNDYISLEIGNYTKINILLKHQHNNPGDFLIYFSKYQGLSFPLNFRHLFIYKLL